MNLDLDIAGKLFPDLLTMAVQLVATGILFWGLKKLLWIPMQNFLAKRAEVVDAQLKDAYNANLLADENHKQSHLILSNAMVEAKTIIENGKLEGLRLKESLLVEAKNEADNKLTSALREIAHQKLQMRDEIEAEIVDVALLAAAKLIEGKVDEIEDRKQIQHFIKDVKN
jgi:F-type H+-transporting ATPase subunit b